MQILFRILWDVAISKGLRSGPFHGRGAPQGLYEPAAGVIGCGELMLCNRCSPARHCWLLLANPGTCLCVMSPKKDFAVILWRLQFAASAPSQSARRSTGSSPPSANASQKTHGYEANLPLLSSDRDFLLYVEHLGLEVA